MLPVKSDYIFLLSRTLTSGNARLVLLMNRDHSIDGPDRTRHELKHEVEKSLCEDQTNSCDIHIWHANDGLESEPSALCLVESTSSPHVDNLDS